jgi:hypothetical protein
MTRGLADSVWRESSFVLPPVVGSGAAENNIRVEGGDSREPKGRRRSKSRTYFSAASKLAGFTNIGSK